MDGTQNDVQVMRTIGRCIYCGTDSGTLGKEHIWPYGLGGRYLLVKASCERCAKITSAFEREVLRGPNLAWRTVLRLPTRRKKERPTHLRVWVEKEGRQEAVDVPADQYPPVLTLPRYKLPAYLDNRPYERGIEVPDMVTWSENASVQRLCTRLGVTRLTFQVTYSTSFARIIGKQAYGFIVGVFGLDAIEQTYVLPAIMGESDDIGRWVGCAGPPEQRLGVGSGWRLTQANDIVFYTDSLTGRTDPWPQYWTVVGRLKQAVVALLPAGGVTPEDVRRILTAQKTE